MRVNLDDGGSAFPVIWRNTSDVNQCAPNGDIVPPLGHAFCEGMSLRDYFAGQALIGWLATYTHPRECGAMRADCSTYAEIAYELADAMLKARATND